MRRRNTISGEKKKTGRIVEVHIWGFNHIYRVLILKKKNLKYIWHNIKIKLDGWSVVVFYNMLVESKV